MRRLLAIGQKYHVGGCILSIPSPRLIEKMNIPSSLSSCLFFSATLK
uniref:Uncharacterized protein n=1 Tax=Anguilla anguilla TaxID=7936 RepID=A0A0E9RQN0_ANGAN